MDSRDIEVELEDIPEHKMATGHSCITLQEIFENRIFINMNGRRYYINRLETKLNNEEVPTHEVELFEITNVGK